MTRKDYIALAAIIKNNHDVKIISPNNFRFVIKSDFINDLTAYIYKNILFKFLLNIFRLIY